MKIEFKKMNVAMIVKTSGVTFCQRCSMINMCVVNKKPYNLHIDTYIERKVPLFQRHM